MENDAVSAGVSKIGGLFSSAEVRILICYILSTLNEPVPGNMLANVLHLEGIANCFEVNDSVASLCKSGHLVTVDEKLDTYVVTEKGKSCAETLKTTLSHAVRDRACNVALKMLARFKNAKDSNIEITSENGKKFISCSALDNGTPFLTVKLLVADDEQAGYIRERFLDDSEIYLKIIELLTGNEKNKA